MNESIVVHLAEEDGVDEILLVSEGAGRRRKCGSRVRF